jgi:hypothetical protein
MLTRYFREAIMCWTDLAMLVNHIAQGRPGVLGWPAFYVFEVVVYTLVIVGLIIYTICETKKVVPFQQASRHWLVMLLIVSFCRGMLYSSLNPPWLAPDEPSHFEYARTLWDLKRIPEKTDISPDVQGEILASMYEFDFWSHNNMAVPPHAPTSFASGLGGDWQGIPPTFVVNDQFLWYIPQVGNEPPLYYILTLPAFWPKLSGGSVLWQLYWMRWITMLLYIFCVVITFLVGQHVLRGVPGGAVGVAALVVFHPMVGYMSTAANNDLAGAALGTLWFAVVALIFLRGWSWKAGGLLLLLTVLTMGMKKTTLFLFPMFLLVVGFYYWSRHVLRIALWLLILTLVLSIIGGAVVLLNSTPEQADMWIVQPSPRVGVRSNFQAYDGDYSFRLESAASGDELRLVQSVAGPTVTELRGKMVVLQAVVKGASDGQRGRLRLVDVAGQHTLSFTAGTTWQTVSMTYTMPTNAQFLRIHLLPGHIPEDVGDVIYYDAVSLRVVDVGDSGGNLLHNGSAEQPASMYRTIVMDIAQPLGLMGYVMPWFMQPSSENLPELLVQAVDFVFMTFWGRFGSLTVAMPVWWEMIWKWTCLVALFGSFLLLISKKFVFTQPELLPVRHSRESGNPRSSRPIDSRFRGNDSPSERETEQLQKFIERKHRFYFGVLLAGVAANVVQVMLPLLRRPDFHWLPQGRFLFPVVMPIVLLLYGGWSRLLPVRLRPWLLPLTIASVAVMDGVALITLVAYSYCRL